jgi:hypothetical protein
MLAKRASRVTSREEIVELHAIEGERNEAGEEYNNKKIVDARVIQCRCLHVEGCFSP